MLSQNVKLQIVRFLAVSVLTVFLTGFVFNLVYFDYTKFPLGIIEFQSNSSELIVSNRLLHKIPEQSENLNVKAVKLPDQTVRELADDEAKISLSRFDQILEVKLKIFPSWFWLTILGVQGGLISVLFNTRIALLLLIGLNLWIVFYFRLGNYFSPIYFVLTILLLRVGFLFAHSSSKADEFWCSKYLKFLVCPLALIAILSGVVLRSNLIHRAETISYHADEPKKFKDISRILTRGSGVEALRDKPIFKHPPLMSKIFALFLDKRDVSNLSLSVRGIQFYIGLLVSVFVLLAIVYSAGTFAGLISAPLFLCGVLPSVTGLYIKEDNLLGLFTALFLLASVLYIKYQRMVWLFLASLIAVYSIGAKYTGLLNVILTGSLMFLVTKKHAVVFVLLGAISGLALLLISMPELVILWERTAQGLFFEISRGAFDHFGYKYPFIDFLGVFGVWKVFFEYENFMFALLAIVSIGYALFHRSDKIIAFFLAGFFIYYFKFEFASGKPPPQYHRYLFPGFLFLLPLIGIFIKNAFSNFPGFSLGLLSIAYWQAWQGLKDISEIKHSTEVRLERSIKKIQENCKAKQQTCYFFRDRLKPESIEKHDDNSVIFLTVSSNNFNRFTEARLSLARFLQYQRFMLLIESARLSRVIRAGQGPKPFLNSTYHVFRINPSVEFINQIREFDKKANTLRERNKRGLLKWYY